MVTAVGVDEKIDQSTNDNFPRLHRAHISCQMDSDLVTVFCGLKFDWTEANNNLDEEPCPMCFNTKICPVCGIKLGGKK